MSKKIETFEEFLRTNQRAREINNQRENNWTYQFENWSLSLKDMFLALVYCAKQDVKISYASLGRVAKIPVQYTRGQSLGVIVGAMLEIIGLYCKTLPKSPKLTSLCVSYVTGFPGGGYFFIFDSQNDGKTPEEQREILLETYKDLKNYNWANALKIAGLNFEDGPAEDVMAHETFPQKNFYIPKSKHVEQVEEIISNETDSCNLTDLQRLWNDREQDRKAKLANELKFSGRVFAVLLSLIILVALCYHIKTGKGDYQWLFVVSVPIAFCLWNIHRIVSLSFHFIDSFIGQRFAGSKS